MQRRKYIKINKLFGKYDNEIDLSSRAIVFIGENGVGKTTIMKILQNLMNFNFKELIKYDFESIDIEVNAKNGRLIKDKLKYEDLLPSNEEIKKLIVSSHLYRDDLYNEWDAHKEAVPVEEKIQGWDDETLTDEEKIDLWDDNLMEDEFNNGHFNTLTNYILNDLIEKNEFKNIIRKITKNEEINELYYDSYIDTLKHNEEDYNVNTYLYNYGWSVWKYGDVKETIENIVSIIKKYIEDKLSSNYKIDFSNRKNITRIINIVNDNINKPVDILDMTKVYNFKDELLKSSLITNQLIEWQSSAPYFYYSTFAHHVEKEVYDDIYRSIQDDEFGSDEYHFKDNSKDISELNTSNIIEINSIINHYFYNHDFVLDINKTSITYYINYNDAEYFINTEKSEEEDKEKLKGRFIKYIRPIIIKNSPFDIDWNKFTTMKDKMFCDFCTKEWHLFEENINPKIKILQELLNKYIMNKDIEVTPMGILIKSKGDNRNIPINSLSSGEKKLIVIFMHCLFNEDVPIIIDEPEISLSIIWQENLLPDLLEKTNIKQVIVATHSSAVISNSILDNYIIPLPNSIVDKEDNNINE